MPNAVQRGQRIHLGLTGERRGAYEGLDGVFEGIWEVLEEYPDETYENETVERFHTVKIEFDNEEIRITVGDDSQGSLRFQDTTHDGDVVHFDAEAGGVYIDDVKISGDG